MGGFQIQPEQSHVDDASTRGAKKTKITKKKAKTIKNEAEKEMSEGVSETEEVSHQL